MADQISRRDFMNGVALTVAAPGLLASAPLAAAAGPAGYPPARTGLRGSHVGAYEVAHALRDGERPDYQHVGVDERFDLVIVGAGLSGLSAAHFYRRRHPRARILLLDTNDDFGGHAKRNEFDVDGRLLIGYGGTQSIDGPQHNYSPVGRALLAELGVHLERFRTAFDNSVYAHHNLTRGVFFKREGFGTDRLVRQPFGSWDDFNEEAVPKGGEQALRTYLAQMPVSEATRAKLLEMYTSRRDVLSGHTREERERILGTTSAADFLRRYWQADDEVLKVLQNRPHGLWAVGIDAVPAGAQLALPGLLGLPEARAQAKEEPYIYHFPDGNASIARLLVRRLIPGCAPGHTMEDIVTAPFDYDLLDAGGPVALRLRSTAIDVRNVGDGVEVVYSQAGRLRRAAGGHAILACYQAMVPYLVGDAIDATQRAALHDNVRAPLVYVTLALRNWQAFAKLGVAYISNPAGRYEVMLDFPVSLGSYRFARGPADPVCLHMEYTPCAPGSGLDMRGQYRAGRGWLYATPFNEIEADIRDELSRMLAGGGFDFDRDVAAITVNRWPHGYSYTPTPLYDPPAVQAARAAAARRPIGRISLAGADCGWNAYTSVAIDEAHRAVAELGQGASQV